MGNHREMRDKIVKGIEKSGGRVLQAEIDGNYFSGVDIVVGVPEKVAEQYRVIVLDMRKFELKI